MPFDLSFIGRGLLPFQGSANTTPDVPGAVPGASDPQDELLQQLLAGLGTTIPEPTPPQMAPQPSGGRQILGSIGDALLAMAAIKAGGRPQAMGPFASRQHEATQMARLQQQEYERRREEVAIANQTMKRQTLIGLMAERGKNRIGPLDRAQLDAQKAALAEQERYHTGILNKPTKPAKPREQVVYDAQNQAHILNLDTNELRPVPGLAKPPSAAQEVAMRGSAVLKLRLGEARDLIERASGIAPTHPEFVAGHEATQPRSRPERFLERTAAADPTGLFSGSDFAADAATYQSFINEIGSLTRSLYGAQGIRSYEEILRLIRAMPPWSSGPARVKQQMDALETAIATADNELKARRPDLFPEGAGTTAAPAPSGETPDQKKARIKAKYGMP